MREKWECTLGIQSIQTIWFLNLINLNLRVDVTTSSYIPIKL